MIWRTPPALRPDGYLLPGSWVFPDGWSQGRYTRPVPAGTEGLELRVPAAEVLWVGSPTALALPDVIGGFTRVPEVGG